MRNQIQYVWEKVPLFRLLWPTAVGIGLAILFPSEHVLWISIGTAVVLSLSLFLRLQPITSGAILMLAFVSIGYGFTCVHTERLFAAHFENGLSASKHDFLKVEVGESPQEKERTIKFIADVDAVIKEGEWTSTHGKVLVYLQKDSSAGALQIGDELMIHSRCVEMKGPKNPGGFDYRAYMRMKQVHHQTYVRSQDWKQLKMGQGWFRVIRGWQQWAVHRLSTLGMGEKEHAVLSALLLGSKQDLDRTQVDAFAKAGAMHVLAVSGLHVGIVYLLLSFTLKPLLRFKEGAAWVAVLSVLVLWGYAILTGLSASVSRSATMFTFLSLGKQLNRKGHVLNTILASAFFLLCVDPFLLADVGFQLSYLAVSGIVLLQPKINGWWRPRCAMLRWTWSLMSVSIAAQLTTAPIALYYFHQFPNYFLLTNLLVIPAASVILPAGIGLLAVSWCKPLAEPLAWGVDLLLWLLNASTEWIASLPYASTEGFDLSIPEVVMLYLFIFLSVSFLLIKYHRLLVFSLASLIGLQALEVREELEQRQREQIVFYSSAKYNAMAWVRGRHLVCISDSVLGPNDPAMQYDIAPHLRTSGAEVRFMVDDAAECIQVGDRQILSMHQATRLLDSMEVDILWLKARTVQSPDEVLALASPNQLVLSAKLDRDARTFWKDKASKAGIVTHDLNEGALILE
ncbi:MAG: ComEC family competence protein [Flavobacteriales bacterium]|nr:ComEC family competence protein [Flavobacteriales bacterium]